MPTPPETDCRDTSYELHGDEIKDPYLWLEDENEAVREWIERQNGYADAHLRGETYESLRPRFEALADVAVYHPVVPRGGRYFQRVKGPDDERPALTVQEGIDTDRDVLFDPNAWAGECSLNWHVPSPAGELVACGIDEEGVEQYDIRVIEVATGDIVADLQKTGRTGPWTFAWAGEGFYYVATGEVGGGNQLEKEIRRHEIGGVDRLVADGIAETVWPLLEADQASETLVVVLSEMATSDEVYTLVDGDLRAAITGYDATFEPQLHDGVAYFETNYRAPFGRLLACPVERLREGGVNPAALREVVPEHDAPLESIATTADGLVAHHQPDARSRLSRYSYGGDRLGDLSLPEYVTVEGMEGNPDAGECFYRVEGFDQPPRIERADLTAGDTQILNAPDVDVPALRVAQEWFESTDGAEVPVFIVHRTGIERDGDTPTVLYGYGGFRANQTPVFNRFRLPFLVDGGVFSQVCARGGKEFGEAWHETGKGTKKQHTFDDVIGAAEHLIKRGYTSAERLGVWGRSNGGLTVGAVVTQRPDLFVAGVATVPLLDMLRFHEFLLGSSWTTEYGSPDEAAAYETLREYSPYHNIEERRYPAMLFETASGDTRVHPAHARKMAARMQAEGEGGPILLRTREATGHGVGKPASMELDEELEKWAFLYEFLDVEPE